MSALRNVLDRPNTEEALDAEIQAAMKAIEHAHETAPFEAEARPGFGPGRVMTPELVAAMRRYARALTERGEYMIQVARDVEEKARAIEEKQV
jgi:hypothetical protein